MANEYIQKEFNKIINQYEFPLNHAMGAAWIMANFKADNLKIFDLRNSSSLVDYAVLGTSQNITQTRAMADEVSFNLKQQEVHLVSFEGYELADWILLDSGDIMVHLFNGPARETYDLDMIYASSPQVKIPEDFYFTKPVTSLEDKEDLKNYF